jgi:spore germination protein GerM
MMRKSLTLAAAAVVVVLVLGVFGWRYFSGRSAAVDDARLTIYSTQLDGQTETARGVPLGAAQDTRSVAFFAATQAIAGPPAGVDAIRFPAGTYVRSAEVRGSTVVVDLSKEVDRLAGGSFDEGATFKSLVWTMTSLPGIDAVEVRIEGLRVAAIPGGHLELDEPLTRSSW